MVKDVAARSAQVLGSPPRLVPLRLDQLGDRELAVIARASDITFYPGDPRLHPFYTTLAHQPDLFEAFMEMGITAMASMSLGRRERELLIMRTGWLCGAPYEFGEHVISGKAVGITSEEVSRVKHGADAEGWNDRDRSLLKAAEELHADAMVSDETWAALAAWMSPRQLVELLMAVGHYHMTAFVQNSLRLELNPHNPGLAAE
jgi:alkylhydroperoxidase family enzyme